MVYRLFPSKYKIVLHSGSHTAMPNTSVFWRALNQSAVAYPEQSEKTGQATVVLFLLAVLGL